MMLPVLPLFALVESYHTRGSLTTAPERAHGERKAREQEERVLRYFRREFAKRLHLFPCHPRERAA